MGGSLAFGTSAGRDMRVEIERGLQDLFADMAAEGLAPPALSSPYPGTEVVIEFDGVGSYSSAFGTNGADLIVEQDDYYATIFAEGGDDIVAAGPLDDALDGGAGADLLGGGMGDDLLIAGGRATDTLVGGAGDDCLAGADGQDRLFGGEGDDRLHVLWLTTGEGGSLLDGGSGDDLLDTSYHGAVTGVWLDMMSNLWVLQVPLTRAVLDTFAAERRGSGDTLLGGAGDDRLISSFGADRLDGGTGGDDLRALDGDDRLDGGAGADTLDGGNGGDMLNGGSEADRLLGGLGDDIVNGGTGDDSVEAGLGNDIVHLADGNDFCGTQVAFGRGDDVIDGGTGDDRLYAGRGDDTVIGGCGDDVVNGGSGADLLTGGAGADVFELRGGYGIDTITDFGDGDRLRIGGLGALTPEGIAAGARVEADGAHLDLGDGHGIWLAGMDAEGLAVLLAIGLDLV